MKRTVWMFVFFISLSFAWAQTEVEPTVESTVEPETLAGLVASRPDLSTFYAGLQETGLLETLDSAGPYTLFAPTDEAFKNLRDLSALQADPDSLEVLLRYHIAEGRITRDLLSGVNVVDTLQGAKLDVLLDASDNLLIAGSGTTTETELEAANGVLYIVDRVLLPPSE